MVHTLKSNPAAPELQAPTVADRVLNASEVRARLPILVRFGIVTALILLIFFQRFQINVGPYFANNGLVAQFFLIAMLLVSNVLRIDPIRATLFSAGMAIMFTAWLLNPANSSFLSAMLLVAAYLAFIFVAKFPDGNEALVRFTLTTFCNLMFIAAICGIVQFFVQFGFHQYWLFDFTQNIPLLFRGTGTYNTVISVGGHFYKSNGFFFREPSTCSQYLALALICEIALRRRKLRRINPLRLATLGLCLLVTYSGTGLATLFIGLMFPLGMKTVLRMSLLGLAAAVIFYGLGDALNLSFTASRVGEFSSPGSSAYSRFIAPFYFIQANIDTFSSTFLVGHGPGSITRSALHRSYFENADPTWAKLLFEYGVLGIFAFAGLMFYSITKSRAPVELIAGLCFGWGIIWGGVALAPEMTGLMFMIAAVAPAFQRGPVRPRQRVVAEVGQLTMPPARPRPR